MVPERGGMVPERGGIVPPTSSIFAFGVSMPSSPAFMMRVVTSAPPRVDDSTALHRKRSIHISFPCQAEDRAESEIKCVVRFAAGLAEDVRMFGGTMTMSPCSSILLTSTRPSVVLPEVLPEPGVWGLAESLCKSIVLGFFS